MNTNLKQICNDHRIFPPGGENPLLEDVLYAFQLKLREFEKSTAATCTSGSGDYVEWAQTRQALQTQIAALRNKNEKFSMIND